MVVTKASVSGGPGGRLPLALKIGGIASAGRAIVNKALFRLISEGAATQLALPGVALLLAFSASTAKAANWYVRPGGAGSRNGTDWNNAWDSGGIAWASVNGGDTIWMAGGTYSSGIIPTKSGSAGNYIYVKRVLGTDSVATSAAGWSTSFDSQVKIAPSSSACISYYTASVGSYMYWDGRVDSGIQLLFQDTQNYNGAVWYSGGGGQTQVVFTNIDMSGPYNGVYHNPSYQIGPIRLVSYSGAISYFTFANCRMHDAVNIIGVLYNCNHITFDHCKIYNGLSSGVNGHANWCIAEYVSDLTMKYCEVWNWTVEGWGFGAGIGTIYLYGNIIRDPALNINGAPTSPRVFEIGGSWGTPYSGYTVGPIYCYNNVFSGIYYGIWTRGSYAACTWSGSARNNIVWNSLSWGPPSSDYNFSDVSLGESHSITGSNPFVNLSGKDYHLTSGSGARNRGQAVATVSGQTLGVDMDGNARGADGTWDIGAYEYGSVSTNAVISVSPSSLMFGAVAQGTTVTNYFTVQNVGGSTLAGSATMSGGSSSFSVSSGGTYSLSAGQSAQVGIRYTPNSSSDSAVVTFSGGGQASANVSGQLQVVMNGLSFPSTAGAITAPFVTNSGGYVSQSVGSGVSDGGTAVYAFRITNPGDYTVSASVNAPGDAANSFYLNVDSQPTDPTMIWDIPVTAGFANQTASWRGNGSDTAPQYAPQVFNLTSGVHQLIIVGREANAQLGQITITPYSSRPGLPSPPPNLRIVASR